MLIRFLEKDRSVGAHLLLLALVVLLAYGSSLVTDVFGDDLILIRNAKNISWSLHDLSQSFRLDQNDMTDGWLPPVFQGFLLHYFRPMIMASIKLDTVLWGTWAPGFHLTNLLCYLAIVFLLYRWGADFGLDGKGRLLLGFLFILYSPNQLTVSVLSSRTELVSAVFILSSIICLGRFYSTRSPLHFAGAFLSAILALGSKENSAMLPFLHVCAAVFLYPPGNENKWAGIKCRAFSILPFFVVIPFYLALRASALGGMPMPFGAFYFHDPGEPGFLLFLVGKLTHLVLTLIYQLPALFPPTLLERSVPLLVVTGLISVITAAGIIRWTKPPFRYFLLVWISLCLAPTLPFVLNPIYMFMCTPVIAVLYVLLYQHFSKSTVPWHAKTARVLLNTAAVAGLVICAFGGVFWRISGEPTRAVARSAIRVLDEHPDVRAVYVLDVPPATLYLAPAIRYAAERHADKRYFLLMPRAELFDEVNVEITQVDEYTFDIRASGESYLRTGLEEVMLADKLPPIQVGMVARHSDYEIEVMETETDPSMHPSGIIERIVRRHFLVPPEGQPGIRTLRFRFKHPLASADRLYVQVVGHDVRKVEFQ